MNWGLLEPQAGIASNKSEHLPALCKLALSQPKTLLYIEGGEKIRDLKSFLEFIGPDTRLILTTRPPIRTTRLKNYNIGPLKIKDAAKAIHHYATEKSRTSHRHPHPQPPNDPGWLLLARDMGGHALGCRLAGEYCGQLNTHPANFHQTLKALGLKPLIQGDDSTENLHILFRQTALALIANCKGSPSVAPAFGVRGLDPAFTSTEEDSHPTNDPTGKTDPAHSAPDHPNTDTIHPDERKSGVKPPHSKASRHPHAATESDAPPNPAIIAWHALTLGGTNPVPLSTLRELGVEGDEGLRALLDLAVATSHQVPAEETGQVEPAYALIHALLSEWARTGLTEFGRPPETLLHPAMQWGRAMRDKVQHHRHVLGGPERYLLLHPIAEALLREIELLPSPEPDARSTGVPPVGQTGVPPVSAAGGTPTIPTGGTPVLRHATLTPADRYTFFHLLARMHELHGIHLDAEPAYRRALARMEQDAPENSPPIATALNNLALLLDSTNRHAEAEPHYRRALAIDEQSYGPHHPTVAIRLNNLAALLDSTNRLAEAEPHYRRALAIDEQSYGPHHPSVARDLNNLAGLLRATNRHAEAEPHYRRMLLIFLQSFGGVPGVHQNVRGGVQNYALACQEQGLAQDVWVPRLLEIFHEANVSDEKRKEILDAVFANS